MKRVSDNKKEEGKMTEKTREEIEALKRSWHIDPCWDIEDTEGFEAHKEELWSYHNECRQKWAEDIFNRQLDRAKDLGLPGHIRLVAYLEKLERRIEELEAKVFVE